MITLRPDSSTTPARRNTSVYTSRFLSGLYAPCQAPCSSRVVGSTPSRRLRTRSDEITGAPRRLPMASATLPIVWFAALAVSETLAPEMSVAALASSTIEPAVAVSSTLPVPAFTSPTVRPFASVTKIPPVPLEAEAVSVPVMSVSTSAVAPAAPIAALAALAVSDRFAPVISVASLPSSAIEPAVATSATSPVPAFTSPTVRPFTSVTKIPPVPLDAEAVRVPVMSVLIASATVPIAWFAAMAVSETLAPEMSLPAFASSIF